MRRYAYFFLSFQYLLSQKIYCVRNHPSLLNAKTSLLASFQYQIKSFSVHPLFPYQKLDNNILFINKDIKIYGIEIFGLDTKF